jgi:hypothetical protein
MNDQEKYWSINLLLLFVINIKFNDSTLFCDQRLINKIFEIHHYILDEININLHLNFFLEAYIHLFNIFMKKICDQKLIFFQKLSTFLF